MSAIEARITNVETRETRVFREDGMFSDKPEVRDYMWIHGGNYSCDCNRALFFARAAGEDDPEDTPCGEGRFTVQLFDSAGNLIGSDADDEPDATP